MTETQEETLILAPGTPGWVDLMSPDVEASRHFYGSLFGWDAFVSPDPAAGGYTMFLKNGKEVAGLGPIYVPGQPSVWNTYILVEDADETARKVQEAGGTVVMPPFDVLEAGRMAVFQDSTGAYISVWQAKEHRGAQLVNQPGGFCWNELATRDMPQAQEFYSKVFGWDHENHDMGNGLIYVEWKLNGKSIGGGMPMGSEYPSEVPPHWLTYFAVEDTDATVAKAQELGASVVVPPTTIPQGRFAVLTDNHGAAFAVIAM